MEAISFSAHADFDQTSGFLDALQPPHVVLVHGEATEMKRLKEALERGAINVGIERNVYMPRVAQPQIIPHKWVTRSSAGLHPVLVVSRVSIVAMTRACFVT